MSNILPGDCCGDINDTYCTECACKDPAFCNNKYPDANCEYWAKYFCTGNYETWMKENCFKACGYC